MKIEESLLTGIWFKDRVDPVDSRFRLVEIRLPMEPTLAKIGYVHEYVGRAVLHRVRRFAAAFLSGTGDITHAHGQRIDREVQAAEDEVPSG